MILMIDFESTIQIIKDLPEKQMTGKLFTPKPLKPKRLLMPVKDKSKVGKAIEKIY